jgi:hypothetical protein
MATKAWHGPLRLASGLFILNSGLAKQKEIELDPVFGRKRRRR